MTVASASKRWFDLRDTCAVEIAHGQGDVLVLASILAVDLAQTGKHENH